MIFRYKVKPNHTPGIVNPAPYNHYVTIQEYDENVHIFHWKTVEKTTLCQMVNQMYNVPDIVYSWEISATQLHYTLSEYDAMSNFVKKYIIDILFPQWRKQDETHEHEDWIREFTLTDGWNCIEIKEDKN